MGWNTERLGRALAFFEQAAAWSGGGNLQGYLQAMLERIAQRASAAEVKELADANALGPRALATLLASRGPAEAAGLLEPLKHAFRDLDEVQDAALAQDRKRALLNSLAGARVARLADWLRQVYEDEPNLRDEVLLRLAEQPDETDWERLVEGLGRGRHEVREACVRALTRIPRRAQDPETLRAVLDAVRQRGPRGGLQLLAVLAHWSGRPIGSRDPAQWSGELAAWERLVLDGKGWRHLHLTVRGAQHTLEVDGRTLAHRRDVARGEGSLAFERPTSGRIWITHVRLRPLGR